jgi:hypothetical protein
VHRAAFIHPANYALVLFGQCMEGHKYTQMHIEASSLAATFNNDNYSALLGFVKGNLAEMSSFARKTEAPTAPGAAPAGFRLDFNFEPPAGDRPSFYLTSSSPDLSVCTHFLSLDFCLNFCPVWSCLLLCRSNVFKHSVAFLKYEAAHADGAVGKPWASNVSFHASCLHCHPCD